MVTLVEVILGGKRMLGERSLDEFYPRYLKMRNGAVRFDLEKYLKSHLSDHQYNLIPQYFWDFIEDLISHRETNFQSSLQRIGIEPNKALIDEVDRTISRETDLHPSFKNLESEFKRRMRVLDLTKYYDRFVSLFNKFLHVSGITFNEIDLHRYAEVAFVMIARRKADRLKYFHDQDTFLLYQRAFFTLMGYQVHVLPRENLEF